MNEEVFDVVLQSTGHFQADLDTHLENLPPDDNFFLEDDFWVCSLPKGVESDSVFDACHSAGFNFKPHRLYGMRYAFCRRVQPDDNNFYEWDSDISIGRTLFLSRLIRPTSIGNASSAKLYFEDDELKTIVPGPTQGLGAHSYIVAKDDYRDWLSMPELEQLRDLLPNYQINAPERIRLARKHIDNAFHAFYLDQRFASLVTSFESLLKVSKYKSTEQFASKAPKLAEMVGLNLSDTDARQMYQDRSAFVHGSAVSFTEVSDELIEHYNSFERVLRRALLRASTEPTFARLFFSDDAVEKAFEA